ncbi:MAG TPA: TIGR01212 family radical SAM protein [Spirochaetia bacterium]|nr:TIGR01212 family radical SAM protein [Spirochaetia bacterium]
MVDPPGAPPYLSYSRYLHERHGCAVHRVAVDAGFSCPNRGADRSRPGCSYCDAHGSRAPYLDGCSGSLERQVQEGISFYRRRHGDGAFILYFQAYSNTNAPVDDLRRVYDHGLALADFRGLNVATRPDCVDGPKADLLASYRDRGLEVWVELGLQTARDQTLSRIRRGHTFADFERAFELLRSRGLKIAVHLIFGLPGEGAAEIQETVSALARLRPDGVKIHNLHVPVATPLAREFARGELTVAGPRRHLQYVISAIEQLPPRTVIMRLTCDTPAEKLAAPRGFWSKERFLSELHAEMRARGAFQGRLCAVP